MNTIHYKEAKAIKIQWTTIKDIAGQYNVMKHNTIQCHTA